MQATKKPGKVKKAKASHSKGSRLDLVFGGPLLFVPTVQKGRVIDLDVYSPRNGHPVGAIFLPKIWFSDAELNDPECERWPDMESFSLLDPHSYSLDITQSAMRLHTAFLVGSIPETNHKVKAGRKLSGDWEVAISIRGYLSAWDSLRLSEVKEGMYQGSDSPLGTHVAGMQRLTYESVTGAEFAGAPREAKEYLTSNVVGGGSLIVMGELPFHPTLLHERQAISALAKLAGLDLHLMTVSPTPRPSRMMRHVNFCLNSTIVA